MVLRFPKLFLAFCVLYVIHVAYGVFFSCRFEQVDSWSHVLIFLVGLNALGFLVWVIHHRFIALVNVLIHLVGALGEAKNILLIQNLPKMCKVPVVITHGLMFVIFLVMYLHSE